MKSFWKLASLSLLLIILLTACKGRNLEKLQENLWQLEAYRDQSGNWIDVIEGTKITARFDDPNIYGSGGCNRYNATFSVDRDQLSVKLGGSTLMFCMPDEVMAQEEAYFSALERTAKFQIKADQLLLFDEGDEEILRFSMIEPLPLTGSWNLIWYKNQNNALATVIEGSQITLEVNEDGSLSGSAGCNNYNSAYTQEQDKISLGPIATTMMFCDEPEGIMEQEADFLAALADASAFVVSDEELLFLDAQGDRLLIFSPQ